MSAQLVLIPGSTFAGDFRVERPLAEGGMGAVYVALQLSTGRERALKVMVPKLAESPDAKRRFEQEARIGGQIESEHVVEVVAAGVDAASGAPWLAMELLQGETLAAFLDRRGALDAATALELFDQLAHAIGAAHAKQIIHRDLKPENLFLATGRRAGGAFTLKVLDFGIAKLLDQARTSATGAIGTPLWMAPEQAQSGKHVTPASDVWAMALIAFRVLSGKCFWRAANDAEAGSMQVFSEMMVEPIPRASERARELGAAALPAGFDEWFARCLNREPMQRYPHATAAHQALRFVLAPGSQVTLVGSPITTSTRRLPTIVGVSALAIAVVGVATSVIVLRGKSQSSRPRSAEEAEDEAPRPARERSVSASASASASVAAAAASAALPSASASVALDADTIGIAECDEYMRLWRTCYKDPITRSRAETGFKNMVADYKKLAAGTPKEREDTRAMCEDSVKKFPHALCR